jgi:hypothetical protein
MNSENNIMSIEEINILTDFYSFLHNDDKLVWKKTKKWKINKWEDMHPRPIDHYKWLTEVLLPELKLNINITYDDILIMENVIDENHYPEDVNKLFDNLGYIKNRNKVDRIEKKLV